MFRLAFEFSEKQRQHARPHVYDLLVRRMSNDLLYRGKMSAFLTHSFCEIVKLFWQNIWLWL